MTDTNDVPLRVVFESQYVPLELPQGSDSTIRQYLIQLRHWGKHLGREPVLSDFSDDAMASFLRSMMRGRSPATVNKCRSHLLALWRFCARRGLVREWPSVNSLREPSRSPRAWTIEELRLLIAACEKTVGWIGPVLANAWWIALVRVLWDTGERISAVMALRWDDIDLDGGWVTYRAETRKFGLEDALHKLKPVTIKALRAIELPRRELVFLWPFGKGYLWKRFAQILARAGLPHGPKDKFHKIRRSVASHAEANGGDATKILRHKSRNVTLGYLDDRIIGAPQAVDVLPEI